MYIALSVVLIVVVGFLLYVAFQPAEFAVARSVTIAAKPPAIFPHLNNPQKMNVWNPWLKLDPAAKISYEGPVEGVGAASSWDGDKNVGAGTATVTESVPFARVKVRLDNQRPFKSSSTVEYTLVEQGSSTLVTWGISGRSPYFMRVICTLFFNMDKMMGDTFLKGLNELKAIVEGGK